MTSDVSISRRAALAAGVVVTGAGLATGLATGLQAEEQKVTEGAKRNGRIKQSIVQWCFNDHWDVEETCRQAVALGVPSVELIGPEHWATLKKYGLVNACVGSHGFKIGFNNPRNWDKCSAILTEKIDQAADAGFPSVITFTGYEEDGIDKGTGADNCVKGFKQIAQHAEKRKVTLVLEMLNSRVSTHPMKGHPGYQGDHTDYCIDIIQRIGSERFKLLFDIYHVQIMDGDVIARIKQHKDYIGHVHTAGNPGRGELDEAQEINYPPIMQALIDVGYKGYVGQEFIPTRDPVAGLKQAVEVCDV